MSVDGKLNTKLWYVANARIPGEKAHVCQIFKMCQAFAHQGFDVTLIHPQRVNSWQMLAVSDVWKYYNVERNFDIKQLKSFDSPSLGVISHPVRFRLQALSFMCNVKGFMSSKADYGLVYSRDIFSTMAILNSSVGSRLAVVFEAHKYPKTFSYWQIKLLRQKLDGLVVLNNWIKNKWIEMGFPADKIMVAQDGVDLTDYKEELSKQEARRKSGLPDHERIVFYAGHLYPWKGVYTLASAIQYLPENYRICFLGGTAEDRAALIGFCQQNKLSNINFLEHVSPGKVPDYLASADVLVLPNSAKDERSRWLTSPLKLFEYMAAGRPIVAADLPSLREVISDGCEALLFEPDNPRSLAQQIIKAVEDVKLAQSIVREAKDKAASYSWDNRAANIQRFMARMIWEAV